MRWQYDIWSPSQLSDLEKHAHRIQEFAEADRFMFDVSSVHLSARFP